MTRYQRSYLAIILVIVVAIVPYPAHTQPKTPSVKSLRVYLFDCGLIKGENPLDSGLKSGDVMNADMVVPCYLIVHPKGTLM
ncbi:hypothetical protein HDF11_000566 [Tunturiibacter psychrotolerans]